MYCRNYAKKNTKKMDIFQKTEFWEVQMSYIVLAEVLLSFSKN
jgi:hypothetical protein